MNPRIEINPLIQHGRPVIKGTRIPVEAILGELAEGMPRDEVATTYRISVDDVIAAIVYASELVSKEQRRPETVLQ
jgi:uncharacterized protein (DUF433 family)